MKEFAQFLYTNREKFFNFKIIEVKIEYIVTNGNI